MYSSIDQLYCDQGVYMKEKINVQSQYLGVVQWFIQEEVTQTFYILESLLLSYHLHRVTVEEQSQLTSKERLP